MAKRNAVVELKRPKEQQMNQYVLQEKAKNPKIKKSRKPMTVYIAPEVHKQLKLFAVAAEKELSEVTETALVEYMAKSQ